MTRTSDVLLDEHRHRTSVVENYSRAGVFWEGQVSDSRVFLIRQCYCPGTEQTARFTGDTASSWSPFTWACSEGRCVSRKRACPSFNSWRTWSRLTNFIVVVICVYYKIFKTVKNDFKLNPARHYHQDRQLLAVCWPCLSPQFPLCLPHTLQVQHSLPPQKSLVKKRLGHFNFYSVRNFLIICAFALFSILKVGRLICVLSVSTECLYFTGATFSPEQAGTPCF